MHGLTEKDVESLFVDDSAGTSLDLQFASVLRRGEFKPLQDGLAHPRLSAKSDIFDKSFSASFPLSLIEKQRIKTTYHNKRANCNYRSIYIL